MRLRTVHGIASLFHLVLLSHPHSPPDTNTHEHARQMVASEQHIPLSSLVIAKAGFDGSEHVGEVVEVKLERETDASVSVSYYIHYLELDKRLDEWVPASNVLEKLDPSTWKTRWACQKWTSLVISRKDRQTHVSRTLSSASGSLILALP